MKRPSFLVAPSIGLLELTFKDNNTLGTMLPLYTPTVYILTSLYLNNSKFASITLLFPVQTKD